MHPNHNPFKVLPCPLILCDLLQAKKKKKKLKEIQKQESLLCVIDILADTWSNYLWPVPKQNWVLLLPCLIFRSHQLWRAYSSTSLSHFLRLLFSRFQYRLLVCFCFCFLWWVKGVWSRGGNCHRSLPPLSLSTVHLQPSLSLIVCGSKDHGPPLGFWRQNTPWTWPFAAEGP